MPRSLISLSIIALASACGCQGSAGNYVSRALKKPAEWASGFAQPPTALASHSSAELLSKPKVPPPALTDENYANVQIAMGQSYEKEGNLEAAEAAYDAAVRNDPKMARAHHRLALVKEKAGKGSESKPHLVKASALAPNDAEIACDMGYWCYLRQDWDQAERHFKLALKLDPGLKRASNNLGLVYARTNRSEDAMRLFADAGLSLAEARTNLGFVLMTEQRLPEARAQFEQALTANPGAEKARDALAALQRVEEESSNLHQVAQRERMAPVRGAVRTVSDEAPTTENSTAAPVKALPLTATARGSVGKTDERATVRPIPFESALRAATSSPVVLVADGDHVIGANETTRQAAHGSSDFASRPIQLSSATGPVATSEGTETVGKDQVKPETSGLVTTPWTPKESGRAAHATQAMAAPLGAVPDAQAASSLRRAGQPNVTNDHRLSPARNSGSIRRITDDGSFLNLGRQGDIVFGTHSPIASENPGSAATSSFVNDDSEHATQSGKSPAIDHGDPPSQDGAGLIKFLGE